MSEINDLMAEHPDQVELITRVWLAGMRDGITTTAQGISKALADHDDLPADVQRVLRAVVHSVTLAAYIPEPPPPPVG